MPLGRRTLPLLALATPLVASPAPPTTLVVPFSAGGAADITARNLAGEAPRVSGGMLALVVENRPGASGALGTQAVARARPDGRTLLLARVGASAILPAIDPRTAYGWDEFTFLGLLDENPVVIAVRADAPWRDLPALLNALRAAPGQLSFPTSGPATILDLGVRQMLATAGLEMDTATAIPLRGGGEAAAALLAGQGDFIANNLPDLLGGLREGRLRALAVAAQGASPLLPGVPTMAEAGLPELNALAGWSALAGPPGLPDGLAEPWVNLVARLGEDADWLAATRRTGSLPRTLPPAATREFIGQQVEMYRSLARRLGLV